MKILIISLLTVGVVFAQEVKSKTPMVTEDAVIALKLISEIEAELQTKYKELVVERRQKVIAAQCERAGIADCEIKLDGSIVAKLKPAPKPQPVK